MANTTIQLDKKTLNELKENKQYPRQTYDELIRNMIKIMNELRKRDQYDKFLHEIQKPKMKEIWDNEDDEVWENV